MTAKRWIWAAGAINLTVSACGQTGQTVPQEQVNAVAILVNDEPPEPAPSPTNAAVPEPTPSPTPADPSNEQVHAEYSPGLRACLDTGEAAHGVSTAMGACFNAELAAQDALLNTAYKQAMGTRTVESRAALRDRQRAWIEARDARCRKEATGGTIDMVEIPGCLLEETVRRRLILQTRAN